MGMGGCLPGGVSWKERCRGRRRTVSSSPCSRRRMPCSRVRVQAHQAGDLERAAQGYQQVLTLLPNEPTRCISFGLVAHRWDETTRPLTLIGRAIAARPSLPAFHASLGNILLALGRASEAADAYGEAVMLDPSNAMAQGTVGPCARIFSRS